MIGGLFKSTSRLALVAAAGVIAGGVAMPSAKAADLGGDCCADLEERVAELEATTARKGNRKVSLTISGHVNRSVLWWDDGFRSRTFSTDNAIANSRFRLTGTARINPALQAGFIIEMDLSIGARSHQVSQIDDDGAAGAPFAAGSNTDGVGGAGDSLLGITLANWYLVHKDYGQVTVGRMNTASAGVTIVDLGGIGVIANSQAFLWGGGFLLRNGAGILSNNGAGAGSSWGSLNCGPNAGGGGPYGVDCGIHALSRRDAVRYDTPTWQGFTFGISYGEDYFWDAALRYAGEGHGFRYAAAVGFRRFQDQEVDTFNLPPGSSTGPTANTHREQWLASASLLHVATGLFVNGAWYQYEFKGTNALEVNGGVAANGNRPDVKMWYVAGGISQNWFGIGKTALYGEYGKTNDGNTGLLAAVAAVGLGPGAGGTYAAGSTVLDSDLRFWGLGIVQNIDAAAMELYVAYRNYSTEMLISGGGANQIPGGLKDIDFIQAGARIQF
jgi:hypothetical protein